MTTELMTKVGKDPEPEVYFKASLAWDYLKRFYVDYRAAGMKDTRGIWINGVEASLADADSVIHLKRQSRVTMSKLDGLLARHGLTLSDFELWAEERDLDYVSGRYQKGDS